MVYIVGYASLMSIESALRTCKVENFSYGYIKGYSRIFNKLGFNPFTEEYYPSTAALNIQKDEDKYLIISYFDVSDEDYIKIRKREYDYDEIEVEVYDIQKQKVSQGIVFISRKSIEYNGEELQLTRDDIKPDKPYLDMCLTALQKTPYFQEFLDTTYLSCGTKKLVDII